MQMTPEETQNFDDMLEVLNALIKQYTGSDAPFHMPHAVVLFCHQYFHDVCKPAIKEEADEATAAGKEHFNIEPLIRGDLETMLMVGYALSQRGNRIVHCTCIEDIGDVVETALREEGHD